MECPKCSGGSFLTEEELVKLVEGTEPNKILLKAIYTCRACQEKFSRLVWDDMGPHRRHLQQQQPQPGMQQPNPYQYQQQPQQKTEEEAAEGLRFF